MASRGTQPKRCCFSPPIRRVSLPASFSPSTAALWPAGNSRRISSRSSETRDASAPDEIRDRHPHAYAVASAAPSTRTIEMYMQVQKKLFTPVQIGPITLKHRIVMPPMSRLRAQWPRGIPSDLMREYYTQRASDGGLILTEATAISPSGRGHRGATCLYSH